MEIKTKLQTKKNIFKKNKKKILKNEQSPLSSHFSYAGHFFMPNE